jgi:hypothetical protein
MASKIVVKLDGSERDGYSAGGDGFLVYAPTLPQAFELVIGCVGHHDPSFKSFVLDLSPRLRSELGKA